MDNIQYLIGTALSLSMSLYILLKHPKTLTMKFLCAFGLTTSIWEASVYFSRMAPDIIMATDFFVINIVSSHISFPIYLLTVLTIRENKKPKYLLMISVPLMVQMVIFTQNYFANYRIVLTDLGWTYRVIGYQLPIVLVSIIFLGYLVAIVFALFHLTLKATFPLARRKYIVLLASFVLFQLVGTTVTNALMAFGLLNQNFSIGGFLQFLTFLSIWFALSLKEESFVSSSIKSKEFSEIYSSFLMVYYNSVVGSHLGEESSMFNDFLKDSNIEDQVNLVKGFTSFREPEGSNLIKLINKNLAFFDKHNVDDEIIESYLRVLNAADSRLGWRSNDLILANMDFLKRSDLIYGVSQGRFLDNIDRDESLDGLEDIDACLRIYRRILLPIANKIIENPVILKEFSENNFTRAIKISNYGEISIKKAREQIPRIPREDQVPFVIDRSNTFLSHIYEKLLMRSDAEIDEILGKLRLVLTLNRDRAISLGLYQTLLGKLATKIPKSQIHKLYSDYLEELVEERTKKLKEAQENLLKSQRLATIGEAAAMVGHDLRNPLQVIVNTLYLADKKLESSPDQDLEEVLKTIGEQVEYMNKIVSDLQDYARPLNPKFVETNILELIEDTLSMISIPSNVEVKTEIENDLNFPKIIIDTSYMKRVFSNLIVNAIQAMPDGGRLTMRASIKGEDAVIQFHDTGVGISEENVPKLFQPLFTTKAKGQGFGLAVCKRLVEAQKGTIAVESKLGQGTTFTIGLPLAPKHDLDVTKLPSPMVMEHNLRNPSRS